MQHFSWVCDLPLSEDTLMPLMRAGLLVHKGKAAAYRRTHAQVFLWADESESGPALRDSEVAAHVGVNERTVSRLRQR